MIPFGATEGTLTTRESDISVKQLENKLVKIQRLKQILRAAGLTIMDAVVRVKISVTGDPSGESHTSVMPPCSQLIVPVFPLLKAARRNNSTHKRAASLVLALLSPLH